MQQLDNTVPDRYLDASRLGTPERLGLAAGALLFAATFLPWFSTSGLGHINGSSGTFNAWQTFGWPLMAYLVWCSVAAFIGPWVVARGHKLTWTPGEMTMVFGVVGVVLVLLNGIVLGRPGEPSGETSLEIGYAVALLALLALTLAGLLKTAQSPRARRPPGVTSSKEA
jgi:hypothetical protein